jgi:dienelactone hydrolase
MRCVRIWSLVWLTLFLQTAWADDGPIPLEDWFRAETFSELTISPDGLHVAGIDHARWPSVFVIDIDASRSTIVASRQFNGRDLFGSWPVSVNWISNDLLAVDYSSGESKAINLSGKRVAMLGERFIRRLVERGESADWVLAYRDEKDGDMDAVNARTGERIKYRIALPGKPIHWAFDAAGALRAVTMVDTAFWAEKTKISNWYRADESAPWQLLEEGPITAEHWVPLRVLPELNTLAVLSRHQRDTYAVFRYDTALRQHVELMAGHPEEDIVGVSGLDQVNLENVITAGIKTKISWFDPRWAALQAAVDAALPGHINHLQGDKHARLLVTSYSDVDPGHWYVLDTKTSELKQIAEARPKIDPAQMRPMETITYTARDGMRIHAYLTRPAGAAIAPGPLVVLIHGGPHVRDRWAWNEEVQLLANRGYTVFQPQFRGSSGFGRRYEEAGYQQWGRAMQDDITDGVQHLIAQGVAERARICIFGASYGGYAALWGTIKTPELYQCAISFAGVSDLNEMLSTRFFDDSTPSSRELQRAHIGDPAKARQALDEVSPLLNAAKVQVPLLIAHGELDTRVLPAQSKTMVKALQALGKPVKWMPFKEAGHGLAWSSDEIEYYTEILDFLKQHIGERAPPGQVVTTPPSTGR